MKNNLLVPRSQFPVPTSNEKISFQNCQPIDQEPIPQVGSILGGFEKRQSGQADQGHRRDRDQRQDDRRQHDRRCF